MKTLTSIKLIVSGVFGYLVYLLGGWDVFLKVLITLIVLDYITGVLVAIYNKKVSSEIGHKGIIKKVVVLIVVAMSYQITLILGNEIPLREIVVSFYIANEGISLLENAGNIGVPIPKKLLEVLEQWDGGDKQ